MVQELLASIVFIKGTAIKHLQIGLLSIIQEVAVQLVLQVVTFMYVMAKLELQLSIAIEPVMFPICKCTRLDAYMELARLYRFSMTIVNWHHATHTVRMLHIEVKG